MTRKQDVIFRGNKDGLQLIFNDQQDFDILKQKLQAHLQKAELFFQGADVVLDIGDLGFSIDQVLEIQNILAFPHGLRLKKIIHGTQEPILKNQKIAKSVEKQQRTSSPKIKAMAQRKRSLADWTTGLNNPETILYKGTLRSGQRIVHEGNVVIVGDVNPGAEIRAAGDIIIMGSLRGLAHAGASGNTEVVIVAFRLAPTQIRIGDVIGRPPEGDLGIPKEPEVAKLEDGVILVEPLDGSRWEGER